MRWPRKREIRDRAGERIYLTRWFLLGGASQDRPGPGLMLHKMHRPDDDSCHHDHPWSFWTLVLWGGYVEEVTVTEDSFIAERRTYIRTRHNRPGMLLYRPAEHTHRIAALPRGVCWTLVLRLRRRRKWGFHTPQGFVYWRTFLDLRGAVAWCDEWIREHRP